MMMVMTKLQLQQEVKFSHNLFVADGIKITSNYENSMRTADKSSKHFEHVNVHCHIS